MDTQLSQACRGALDGVGLGRGLSGNGVGFGLRCSESDLVLGMLPHFFEKPRSE